MLQLFAFVKVLAAGRSGGRGLARVLAVLRNEDGQTTAEYALVMLAAAAVAVVLITWAQTSGTLPSFFDQIITDISGNA